MTTLAKPAPRLASTLDQRAVADVANEATGASRFHGWAVAGAALAAVDLALAAVAVVIV